MIQSPPKTHTPSVAQLVLSIVGLVSGLMGILSLAAVLALQNSITEIASLDISQFSYFIWISFALTLLTVPSLILSIRRLSKKEIVPPYRHRFLLSSAAFALIVPITFLAYKAAQGALPAFVKASLTMLLVAIPLWWFVEYGSHQLFSGSAQRRWGLLIFGFFVTLPVVIFVECVVLGLAAGGGILWLSKQSQFTPLLMQLQTEFMLHPTELPNISNMIEPLLARPEIIAAGVFGISVVIPLIEEFFKPLALWFFIKKDWSPSEGFTAGLVSGAAFALVESLTSLGAVSNDIWLATLGGRVGTGLLHIFTTGLTGWALTASWKDGKYIRIGLVYLLSVFMHGCWNFFAILVGVKSLSIPSFTALSAQSVYILISIGVLMFIGLFFMNRKLRQQAIPPQFLPPLPTPPPVPDQTID